MVELIDDTSIEGYEFFRQCEWCEKDIVKYKAQKMLYGDDVITWYICKKCSRPLKKRGFILTLVKETK